jgi:hypothetical protein
MAPVAAATGCPRCKKPLVDPNGLGWCQSCGYCRSLAECKLKTDAPLPLSEPNALMTTGSAILQMPTWFWVTLFGATTIVIGTILGARHTNWTDLQRAVFCSIQVGVGVAMMLTGQFIGLVRVAPEDPSISFKDAIFPFRLYGLIFKHLPGTRLAVFLGMWGLTAAITASIVVGGMGHWFTYLPNKARPYIVEKIPKS